MVNQIEEKGFCLRCLEIKTQDHHCNGEYTIRTGEKKKSDCVKHQGTHFLVCPCAIEKAQAERAKIKDENGEARKEVSDEPDETDSQKGGAASFHAPVFLNNVILGTTLAERETVTCLDDSNAEFKMSLLYDTGGDNSHIFMDVGEEKCISKKKVDFTIKTMTGATRIKGSSYTIKFQTPKGAIVHEFLGAKNLKEYRPEVTVEVPKAFLEYCTTEELKQEEGNLVALLGQDAQESFPETIAMVSALKLTRSRLTGKYIMSGNAEKNEENDAWSHLKKYETISPPMFIPAYKMEPVAVTDQRDRAHLGLPPIYFRKPMRRIPNMIVIP